MPSPTSSRLAPALPALPWARWTEATIVLGVWALFMAVAVVARGLLDPIPLTGHTVATAIVEYGPWLVATPLVLWATRRVPLVGPGWMRGLAVHAVLALAVVMAVSGAHSAGFSALGPPPSVGPPRGDGPPPRAEAGRRIDDGPRRGGPDNGRDRIRAGGPRPVWTPSLNVFLYLALLGAGVGRAQAAVLAARRADAERAEAEAARLGEQVAEARLAALRTQLQPHFLFNALNAVAAYADDDPDEVRRIVARLSSLLRRVLDADARPLVPLREELAFARDYLDLQRVRFEHLGVDEDVDEALLGVSIPALVLQPLVENAVEHGAAGRAGGHVWIGARRKADRLVVTIGDDGPGLDGPSASRADHHGVGLANTRARLEAHYGAAATLDLRDRSGGGAEAVLTVPLPSPDEDDD